MSVAAPPSGDIPCRSPSTVSDARLRAMYDRAAGLARIGAWECDLASEELTWTDGVYDIFEIPRGSALDRDATVALYEEESRRRMQLARAGAIRDHTGFSLDVRIRTALGTLRWVRLVATVDCEDGRPVRILGSKQDITSEYEMLARLRDIAERDALTGIANRSVFQSQFHDLTAYDLRTTPLATLMLIDLDGFKQLNDRYGHAAGDACLRTVADRLRHIARDAALVARIGGDEFAVLISRSCHPDRFTILFDDCLTSLHQPIEWQGRSLAIGASIGIAHFPPPELFDAQVLFAQADAALYEAKKAGKNRRRIHAVA